MTFHRILRISVAIHLLVWGLMKGLSQSLARCLRRGLFVTTLLTGHLEWDIRKTIGRDSMCKSVASGMFCRITKTQDGLFNEYLSINIICVSFSHYCFYISVT